MNKLAYILCTKSKSEQAWRLRSGVTSLKFLLSFNEENSGLTFSMFV
uniref:Uncharacterized protein n=1 Tax=Lepeophtheirus salmonis TaxID=72036 RepID=A0A0K2UVF7_LEPSM